MVVLSSAELVMLSHSGGEGGMPNKASVEQAVVGGGRVVLVVVLVMVVLVIGAWWVQASRAC